MRETYQKTAESVRLAAERLAILMPGMMSVCHAWRAWRIDRVYLFGSTARGECDGLSDNDLLVVVCDDDWPKVTETTREAFEQVSLEELRFTDTALSISFIRRSPYDRPDDYDDLSLAMIGAIHDTKEHGILLYGRT